MIDMVHLTKSKKLDKTLGLIFGNKETVILSFDFISELNELTKALPNMTFFNKVERYISLQKVWHKVRS